MIATEPREPSIAVVTWGVAVTGADLKMPQEQLQLQVQPTT